MCTHMKNYHMLHTLQELNLSSPFWGYHSMKEGKKGGKGKSKEEGNTLTRQEYMPL